jgi:hypothetical protein
MAAHSAEDRPSPHTSWIVWLGLGVVLLAAAALSFEALTDLALSVGIRPALAWLLPVVVDAGAAVSTAVWLGRGSARDAARFAGRMTVGLLVITVLGNATALGMHAYGITPPWWTAALVGMVPPAVVWAGVHLVVMLVRQPVREEVLEPDRVVETAVRVDRTTETTPDRPALEAVADQPDEDELLPAVREWIAKQTGSPSQRQLRSEFGIGAGRARKLMEAAA